MPFDQFSFGRDCGSSARDRPGVRPEAFGQATDKISGLSMMQKAAAFSFCLLHLIGGSEYSSR
jgi:hypothetical protein